MNHLQKYIKDKGLDQPAGHGGARLSDRSVIDPDKRSRQLQYYYEHVKNGTKAGKKDFTKIVNGRKQCSKCLFWKDLDQFHKQKRRGETKPVADCRTCRNEHQLQRYHRKRSEQKDKDLKIQMKRFRNCRITQKDGSVIVYDSEGRPKEIIKKKTA